MPKHGPPQHQVPVASRRIGSLIKDNSLYGIYLLFLPCWFCDPFTKSIYYVSTDTRVIPTSPFTLVHLLIIPEPKLHSSAARGNLYVLMDHRGLYTSKLMLKKKPHTWIRHHLWYVNQFYTQWQDHTNVYAGHIFICDVFIRMIKVKTVTTEDCRAKNRWCMVQHYIIHQRIDENICAIG